MFKTIGLRNFRCFSSVELDLTGPRDRPLGYAAIYGMNASGKTSLVEAVRFLKQSALTFESQSVSQDVPDATGTDFGRLLASAMASRRIDLGDLVRESIMDGSPDGMSLSFRFSVDGRDAVYDMSFSTDCALVSETLRYVSSSGRTIEYFGISSQDGRVRSALHRDAFPESEFRSSLQNMIPAYWGRHTLMSMIVYEAGRRNPGYMTELTPRLMKVVAYLRDLNSGDTGIGGETARTMESDLGHGWIASGDRDVAEAYRAAVDRFFSRIDRDVESVVYEYRESQGNQLEYTMYFNRYISGKVRRIPFHRESAGVRKLLRLLPMLLGCADGRVSFVDEIDSGIHDKLMRDLFIQILPDMRGQLIVTTHNTSLLKDLDPHNVFLVDIDADGDRTVRSISSMTRTRDSNNNQTRYLRGDMGAVPHIGSVDMANIVQHLREDLR